RLLARLALSGNCEPSSGTRASLPSRSERQHPTRSATFVAVTAPVATSMGARVETIDAPSDPRWDAFVASHEGASAYQLSAWAPILRRSYGCSPRYLALGSAGSIEGVLPLMRSRGAVAGKRLRSLPMVGSVGRLARTTEGTRALLDAACRMRHETGARVWTLRAREAGYDELVPELRLVRRFQTWLAPLPA